MLSRFRESLTMPLTERYFDEDELIEIFDFAGDVNDDYLRMEVLLCAARFYPESKDLLQRKALFYNQYSDDVSSKYIEDNPQESGMLWDIMRARQMRDLDTNSKKDLLQKIMDSYSDFSDEEVIQFVDLASSMGMYSWLTTNFDKLREKADYLCILLYEMAIVADFNQDIKKAIQMLEELTELEPYNPFYWLMLAKEYAAFDDAEKALSAIDYSLAISPNDIHAIFVKAKLVYAHYEDSDKAIDLLKQILVVKPDSSEAIRVLAAIYTDNHERLLAKTVLEDFLKKYPHTAVEIIPDLIIYRPEQIDKLLDTFYQVSEENSQIIWVSWAHQLSMNGYPDLADAVLDAYQRNSGESIVSMFPVENHFYQKRFVEALNLLSSYLNDQDNQELDYAELIAIHLISMLKIGDVESVQMFCTFFERNSTIKRFNSLSHRLEYIGLLKLVKSIKSKLRKGYNPSDWENYDPFEIWE